MMVANRKPIYGVVYHIPEQRVIIDECCFGSCGKIIVGAIDGGEGIGTLFPCRIPAAECPQFDKEMDEPIGDVMGDPLFIRKLKP